MPLWSKIDEDAGKPKHLNVADAAKTFFVSLEEAVLPANILKGITASGWWVVTHHVDSQGTPRYKAEMLVSAPALNADCGDASTGDDAVVADTNSVVVIDTQPTGQNSASGVATFVVVASGGTPTYQWYEALPGSTTFAPIAGAHPDFSGETTGTLVMSNIIVGDDNHQVRCVVGNTAGAVKVASATVLVNFVS